MGHRPSLHLAQLVPRIQGVLIALGRLVEHLAQNRIDRTLSGFLLLGGCARSVLNALQGYPSSYVIVRLKTRSRRVCFGLQRRIG